MLLGPWMIKSAFTAGRIRLRTRAGPPRLVVRQSALRCVIISKDISRCTHHYVSLTANFTDNAHVLVPASSPLHSHLRLGPANDRITPVYGTGSSSKLCAKQQKVIFLAWQLDVTLSLFLASLARHVATSQEAQPHHHTSKPLPPPASQLFAPRRECVRALAQLLYENGERLGTRFGDILPPLLGLADPSAVNLENR